MRRLVPFVAVVATLGLGSVTPAHADTVSEAAVYVNGTAVGVCATFVGGPSGGGSSGPLCQFNVPTGATSVSLEAADLTRLPVGGFITFYPGDPTDRSPFCDRRTVDVPDGTHLVLLQVATIVDFAGRSTCGFGTAGTVAAGFTVAG